MALSLGVKVGTRIAVGRNELEVTSIGPGARAMLTLRDGKHVSISDEERVQVFPEVYVSFGPTKSYAATTGTRLAFEAPRSIGITRL